MPTVKKFEKRLEKLKKICKDPKYAGVTDISSKELKEAYVKEVESICKTKPYKNLASFVADIIISLLGYIPVLGHNDILAKMAKIVYAQSVIPALLLCLPPLSVFFPNKYTEHENQLCFKINSA